MTQVVAQNKKDDENLNCCRENAVIVIKVEKKTTERIIYFGPAPVWSLVIKIKIIESSYVV